MDIYKVNNYTDEQLYEILDMNNPTDRELEAKIIQMLRKYENIPSDIGKQLHSFFNNIYKRFFETDSDDEESENIKEGFTPTDPNITTTPPGKTSEPTPTQPGYQSQNIASVQQFNYAPDKLQLNPLLNQTIKRVVSIDSQYRNIGTYPSTTSFSFDLTEPLRDVVSLKLYSIQIPYTWYTISKSFGSNFFYLRGNSPGITDASYNYKISINPGNYDQTTLPAALNKSFYDISNNEASDVNFNGLDLITYDSTTAKTTVNLNIQNTFNETYYNLYFPYFQYPINFDTTDGDTLQYSIPGFLGFNSPTYSMNSIHSNERFYTTADISNQTRPIFFLDDSKNYFTVIQYLGYDQFSSYDVRSTVLNTYKVQLMNNGIPFRGSVSRQSIVNATNEAITKSGLFDSVSKIERVDIIDTSNINYGYSYYQLNLTLNRYSTKYIPNSKLVVIFPYEVMQENLYGEYYTIWVNEPPFIVNDILYTSCFFFDFPTNTFSEFISESTAIKSTFVVDLSTNIIMTCTEPGYNYSSINDFIMNVLPNTYNYTQFLNAITASFQAKNTPTDTYFNMTNTQAYLDSSEIFNLGIDLTKKFTNINYSVTIDNNSFIKKPNNFTTSYSIIYKPGTSGNTITGNLYDISYINLRIQKLYTGYSLDTSCVLLINSDSTTYFDGGNKNAAQIGVYLSQRGSFLSYPTFDAFLTAISNSFLTTSITSSINTQQPVKLTGITTNTGYVDHIDISLNVNCNYYLEERNYDVSFVDFSYNITSAINIWHPFNIYSYYNSYIHDSTTGSNYIKGYLPVSEEVLGTITLYDNCNNTIEFNTTDSNIPSDNIIISIPAGTYTSGQLVNNINTAFSQNPKTYGSYIETLILGNLNYSRIWINVNRIYTSQDYILDFYDPVNFVSCYVGSSSVQNTTWDSTIGWILGFRDYTQYILTKQNQTENTGNTGNPYYYKTSVSGAYIITQNIDPNSNLLSSVTIKLTGDTSLSTNLYNYFLISLDDFIQNHLNDGLVTITRSQTSVQLPDYTYSTTKTCDPVTNELVSTFSNQQDSDNVTNAQLYAINQSIVSQQNPSKQYSAGPFIKDLFGIIPVKPPAKTGDYYTEFGGSLQNQERLYFGPVNIRKMSIQLLTDRGTTLDLNNSNWSFSFICEQLYKATST